MSYNYALVNKPNIQKLIDGIEKNRDAWDIEMKRFASHAGEAAAATIEHPCQSPCCIVGFAPSCGISIRPDQEWGDYSEENLIVIDMNEGGYELDVFAFEVFWPDDIDEALARLKLIIAEKVPENWSYDDRFHLRGSV